MCMFCKILLCMSYLWMQKMSYFYQRGALGPNSEILNTWKIYAISIFIYFLCIFFFELIVRRASASISVDFLYQLWFSS